MRIFLMGLFLCLLCSIGFSDSFILVNGNSVDGTIKLETETSYIILPAINGIYVGGALKLEKKEIAEVIKTSTDYLPNQITLSEKRRLEKEASERNERYYKQAEVELWFYRFLKYKVSVGDLISSYYLFDFLNK